MIFLRSKGRLMGLSEQEALDNLVSQMRVQRAIGQKIRYLKSGEEE
jgi:hypothetical protein